MAAELRMLSYQLPEIVFSIPEIVYKRTRHISLYRDKSPCALGSCLWLH